MTGVDMTQMNRTVGSARAASEAASRKDDASAAFARMLREKDRSEETRETKQTQDKDTPAEKTEPEKTDTGKADTEKTDAGKAGPEKTDTGTAGTGKTEAGKDSGIGEEGKNTPDTQLDMLLAAAMLQLQVNAPEQSAQGKAEAAIAIAGGEQTTEAAAAETGVVQAPGTAGIPVEKAAEQGVQMEAASLMETARSETSETGSVLTKTDSEKGADVKQVSQTLQDNRASSSAAPDEAPAAETRDREQKPSSGEDKTSGNTGGDPAAGTIVRADGGNGVRQTQFSTMSSAQPSGETVKTTPDTLPADVGHALAARLPGKDGTLTIELEPASLGKLTIKVVYEEGKAAVSILSTNPKTLELLSRSASELAGILEEKTGQETVVYTHQPEQQSYDERQGGGRQQDQDRREEKRERPSDSFAQQLRLGLV